MQRTISWQHEGNFPAPSPVSSHSWFSLPWHFWTQRPKDMNQTRILGVTRKHICDAAIVIWRMAPQGTTVCSHCSHWGGRRNPWSEDIHGERQARPDRAGNRLGSKLSARAGPAQELAAFHSSDHQASRPSMDFQKMPLHVSLTKPDTYLLQCANFLLIEYLFY